MTYKAGLDTFGDIVVVQEPDSPGVKMGCLLALDPGQNLGWAVIGAGGDGPMQSRIRAAGVVHLHDGTKINYAKAIDSVSEILDTWRPLRVVVEETAIFGGGRTFVNTLPIEVAAIIKAVAQGPGLSPSMISPSTVKAYLGDGRMKKTQVVLAVRNIYPRFPIHYDGAKGKKRAIPPHAFDAIAIGLASLQRDGLPWTVKA